MRNLMRSRNAFTLEPPLEPWTVSTVTIVRCGMVHRHGISCRLRLFDIIRKVRLKLTALRRNWRFCTKFAADLPECANTREFA